MLPLLSNKARVFGLISPVLSPCVRGRNLLEDRKVNKSNRCLPACAGATPGSQTGLLSHRTQGSCFIESIVWNLSTGVNSRRHVGIIEIFTYFLFHSTHFSKVLFGGCANASSASAAITRAQSPSMGSPIHNPHSSRRQRGWPSVSRRASTLRRMRFINGQSLVIVVNHF